MVDVLGNLKERVGLFVAFHYIDNYSMWCSKCKSNKGLKDGEYCSTCGGKITERPKCACGVYINYEFKYCPNCGNKNHKES